MNSQCLKTFLVRAFIGLSVALTAIVPVGAQSDLQIVVTVPFDFIVGDRTLPAGDYYLRPYSTTQGVMMITNQDKKTTTIFMARFAERLKPQDRPMLVFNRYEDQYFLREIWSAYVDGYELPKSRTERSVEKDIAQSDSRHLEVVQITGAPQ